MNHLGATVQKKGGFKGVFASTLRDDSAPDARAKADKIMRDLVIRLDKKRAGPCDPAFDLGGRHRAPRPGHAQRPILPMERQTCFRPRVAKWVLETPRSRPTDRTCASSTTRQAAARAREKTSRSIESTSSGRSNGY